MKIVNLGGLILALVLVCCQIQGLVALECECDDIPPPNSDPNGPPHNCMEQKLWGKCEADWMVADGYCGISCGWCSCGAPVEEEATTIIFKSSEEDTSVKKEARIECSKDCTDFSPDAEFTCQQQASFGKCKAQWMIDDGFCAASCGRCILCEQDEEEKENVKEDDKIKKPASKAPSLLILSAPASEDCDDVPPTDDLSCAEQKEFEKCGRSWMLEGGYCKKTCGLCSSTTTADADITNTTTVVEKEDAVVVKETRVQNEKKTVEKEQEVVSEEEEEQRAAKVRQDMQKLLAQNSDMEYMEALGFELSRSAIRDALKADATSSEAPLPSMDVEEMQTVSAPAVEQLTSIDNIQATAEALPATEAKPQEAGLPYKQKYQRKQQGKKELQAPVVENIQKDQKDEVSATEAVAAPILTVFGSGVLKDLAQVPGIVDTFGNAAAGLNSNGEEVEETTTTTVNKTPVQDDSKDSKKEKKQTKESTDTATSASHNMPKAPQKLLSPSTTEILDAPKTETVADGASQNKNKNSNCKNTIVEEVSLHPDLSLLSSILQEVDLNGILAGIGSPVTLLAPDNRSLNTLLESANVNLTTALKENSPVLNSLKHLILYHLLDMPFDGETMQDIAIANTKLGSEFPIFVEGSGSEKIVFEALHSVGEISVKDAVEACGSYVHIIEGVLMPYQKFEDIPNHDVEVDPFLSPPPPPPSPTPSPIPSPSPKPIPSPACHYATPFEILREHDEVSMFVDFMKTFGLLNRIELTNEPATLFVPVNKAVLAVASQLGTDEENLLNDFLSSGNTQLVSSILNYHIVSGQRVAAADLDEDTPLQTVQGAMLFPEESGTTAAAFIQGVGSTARIISGNIDGGACQVSVHFIDTMLLPFTAGSATLNSTINSIMACQDELLPGVPSCDDVVRAGLCQDSGVQEGGYCMKACGHCTAAEELKMKDSIVLESAAAPAQQQKIEEEKGCKNMQDLLVDNWELSIFRSLLDDNVKAMLGQSGRPITVFAPSDSAFRELLEMPDGKNLQNSMSNVVNLLSYHTIDGVFAAQNLKDGDILSTLYKQESGDAMKLTIRRTTDNNIVVEGGGSQAKMTGGDIISCQGVIHVIDNVLLPNAQATN